MTRAHLLIRIRTDRGCPYVDHVGIYSVGPGDIETYSREIYAEVMRDFGGCDSFVEACDEIIERIQGWKSYTWIREWLDNGPPESIKDFESIIEKIGARTEYDLCIIEKCQDCGCVLTHERRKDHLQRCGKCALEYLKEFIRERWMIRAKDESEV